MPFASLFQTPPDFGVPTLIEPGVWWLRMPLPFKLNHINLWLLEDGDGFTLVDTGVATPDVRAHWDNVIDTFLAGRAITRVICTHTHPDHIGMAGELCSRFRAPLWMTAGEYLLGRILVADLPGVQRDDLVHFYDRHGLTAEKAEETGMARGGMFRRLVTEMPASYRRMQEGDLISIGGHDWLVHTGFGHSPEHASLICADRGLMISGDMLLPKISTNVSVFSSEPDGNPLQQFLDSVRRMQQLPDSLRVLPSHGIPFTGVAHRTQALLDHHDERLDALLGALDDRKSAREIIPALFSRELDSHQLSFAIGEAIAHLHLLMYRGQVQRHVDAAGKITFSKLESA